MAKRKLSSITIRPGKNGGHTVRHEYAPAAQYTRGNSGGLSMGMPQTEDHSFGPADSQGMMQHLAQALALGKSGGTPEE